MKTNPILTAKQEQFCKEYLIDKNATQAAIRAGYSEHTARAIGAENLTKPIISEKIEAEIKKQEKRTEITADYVIKSLKFVADKCLQNEQQKSRNKILPILFSYVLP